MIGSRLRLCSTKTTSTFWLFTTRGIPPREPWFRRLIARSLDGRLSTSTASHHRHHTARSNLICDLMACGVCRESNTVSQRFDLNSQKSMSWRTLSTGSFWHRLRRGRCAMGHIDKRIQSRLTRSFIHCPRQASSEPHTSSIGQGDRSWHSGTIQGGSSCCPPGAIAEGPTMQRSILRSECEGFRRQLQVLPLTEVKNSRSNRS